MPHVIIIAGPNGAGKSTTALTLLKNVIHIKDFVNADVIAQGLSAFQPEKAAMSAGRIMLERINALAASGVDFAFETTLASRIFARHIERWKRQGYQCYLAFLWLRDVELAISRVADRIKMGGHAVPEETIRRRYVAGLRNFFSLYSPLVGSWAMYNNSDTGKMGLIAEKTKEHIAIQEKAIWQLLMEEYNA